MTGVIVNVLIECTEESLFSEIACTHILPLSTPTYIVEHSIINMWNVIIRRLVCFHKFFMIT